MGMFLVSVRILYHPAVRTVLLYFFIFCSLPLRDDVIYMHHFCVLHLEYPLWTYPGTAQDQGYRRHGFWIRAVNRLVLVWAWKLTWFLPGWSILTWFQCGGSNLIWFQFRDRNQFVWCLGVENDLVLVSGSKVTWSLCDDARPRIDTASWQIGVLRSRRPLSHRWLSSSVVHPLQSNKRGPGFKFQSGMTE